MSIVQAYTEAYRNYLFDESRTMGRADYIAFPRSEAELVEAVRFAHDNHVPLTAQGARTGLAGGASPQGGMILNLSRMNRILGIRRDEAGGLSPDRLGEKLVRNVERRHMRFRLRVAKPDQHLAVWLHALLPPWLNGRVLCAYYQGKRKA